MRQAEKSDSPTPPKRMRTNALSKGTPNRVSILATLKKIPLFQDLTPKELRRIEETKKNREFLDVQYQQVKDAVTRGEETITKLQQQKGRLRPGGQTEMELVRLAQLENALADTQANRQILSTRVEAVQRALDQGRSQEAKNAPEKPGKGNQKDDDLAAASRAAENQARTAFKAAQDQLARSETKFASLRERYTDDHPQVQITRDEIVRQQARVMQLARELPAESIPTNPSANPSDRLGLQRQLEGLDRESQALATKEEALKIQVARIRGELRGLSQDEAEFANLRRSVEANRNLLAVLSDRLMAARIREQGDPSVIRIVDPPSFPLQTNASKTQKFMLVVIGFAASAAFGLAFAVELWRQPVETEADVERHIGLPVLGSVVVMENAAKNSGG